MLSPCGQTPLVDTALPQQAIVWALTESYFHICYLSFVQGQKVESVDSIAGWWRRKLWMWHSRVVYPTTAGSYSKVSWKTAGGRRPQPAISGASHVIIKPCCVVLPSVIQHLQLRVGYFLSPGSWFAPHQLSSHRDCHWETLNQLTAISFSFKERKDKISSLCVRLLSYIARLLTKIQIFPCKIQLVSYKRKLGSDHYLRD